MKVYIASPFAARNLANEIREDLEALGHEVTSSWLNGTRPIAPESIGTSPGHEDDTVARHAQSDLDDVARSDAVLMLSSSFIAFQTGLPDKWLHTGGRHVEVGFALAHDVPVVVVGEAENIFGRALCLVHDTLEDAYEALRTAILPAAVAG